MHYASAVHNTNTHTHICTYVITHTHTQILINLLYTPQHTISKILYRKNQGLFVVTIDDIYITYKMIEMVKNVFLLVSVNIKTEQCLSTKENKNEMHLNYQGD